MVGQAPYEELLEEVKCPPELQAALEGVWVDGDEQYSVIAKLTRDDEENVAFHTVYRFLCKFGMPKDGNPREGGRSRAWAAVVKWVASRFAI